MKKYELKKNDIELKKMEEIKEGCTLDQQDSNPQLVASFSDKEDALEELKKYTSDAKKMSGYVLFTEYYAEVAEYEDDEWIGGGDILAFSEIK